MINNTESVSVLSGKSNTPNVVFVRFLSNPRSDLSVVRVALQEKQHRRNLRNVMSSADV